MDTRHIQSKAVTPSDETSSPGNPNRSWSVSGVVDALQGAIKTILTLAILALFLYIGQYLVQFSGLDSQAVTTRPADAAILNSDKPMTIRFADAPFAFYQEHYAGSDEMLQQRVQEACYRMAVASPSPVTAPSAEESRLLNTLSASACSAPGEGILVCQASPTLPLFVGLRCPATDFSAAVTPEMVRTARVVSWGFALPSAVNEWKIRAIGKGTESGNISSISLPPEVLKILQLNTRGGDSIVAFSSQSKLSEQIASFDRYFAEQQWQKGTPWNVSSDHGRGIYTRRMGDRVEEATVHIQRDGSSSPSERIPRWHGIINMEQYDQTD